MKHLTVEQLNGMNKAQVVEHATALQAIPTIKPIPAIEGKEQYTDDKGIIVPAVPAVPAKSITEQISALPEVAAYLTACSEIDKTNETAKTTFETSAEFVTGKNTLDVLTKFTTENKEKIAKVVSLNEKFNAENSNTKTPARLKQQITAKIVSEIEAIENTYTFEGGTVSLATGYPVITFGGKEYIYEGTLPELPIFTPAADPVFTSDAMVTVPLSFLFSGRKTARAAKAPKVEGSTSAASGSGTLTDEIKAEIQALRTANLAAGNSAGKGLSKIEAKYGISHGTAGGYIATLK